MVCSIGSRGMAAIARLLAAGNVSQTIAEDLAHWDLATKYVQRELREADEANLLDEEDMHVFGLKPMADPLHLVCCNACKKPVKVSQYAAHAELCKSLSYVEDIISELNGGTGYKKPPRKKRRKSLTTSATTSVGYQQRLENRIGTPASEPNSNEQIHPNSSFVDAKRNSPCVDGTLMMDKSACFNPGNTEHSTGSVPPPTKHKKMIAAKGPTASDHSETANGVIKSTCTSTQESLKYVPVSPLATKIFFSQRNQRLRSAIRHLYYDASTKEPLATAVKPQELHSTAIPSCSSFSNNVKNEQLDDPQENVCQNLC